MFSDLKISRFGKEQTNVQVCDQPSSRPWTEALPAHCWLGHPSLHQPFSLVNIDGLVDDDDNVDNYSCLIVVTLHWLIDLLVMTDKIDNIDNNGNINDDIIDDSGGGFQLFVATLGGS